MTRLPTGATRVVILVILAAAALWIVASIAGLAIVEWARSLH